MDNTMFRYVAFIWCALMTADAAAAQRFYPALPGRTTEAMPAPMEGMSYTVITSRRPA